MPQAKPMNLTEDTMDASEAPTDDGDVSQPGRYVSSCDEEDRQESEAMQELQEEVCRLHDQVWRTLHFCCMLCCIEFCNFVCFE